MKKERKKEKKPHQNTDKKNRRYKASGLNRKKQKQWTYEEICKDKLWYRDTDILYKVAGSEENISNSLGLNIDRRVLKTEPNMKSWFMIICMWIMI